jgi:hypothetical protein
MVDYNSIFLDKTGQSNMATPDWDSDRITAFLDARAYIVSREYATPWADFESVPDQYQYPVVIYSAIEYWWLKAGEYLTKFDINVSGGGATGQKSSQLFYRALEMINYLKKELEIVGKTMIDSTGTGDILVGTLIKRSKFTGYLVPRSDDPKGDWT